MLTSEKTFKNIDGKIVDPVCGMTVDPDSTQLFSVYKGTKYYFCAEGCRRSFEADPEKFLKP